MSSPVEQASEPSENNFGDNRDASPSRDQQITGPMMSPPTPVLVRANFRFKGMNNDELNFRKGDIITVTQQIDGGWWEGTFNGKTGWFPSNYVTPTSSPSLNRHQQSALPSNTLPIVEESQMNGHAQEGSVTGNEEEDISGGTINQEAPVQYGSSTLPHQMKDYPTRKRESMILYHNVVLDNIIDSEGAFVNDMQALITSVLIPLRLRCDQGDEEKGKEGQEEEELSSSLPTNHLIDDVLDTRVTSSSLPVISPLSSLAKDFTLDEVSKLGGNLDDILAFHQELLHKLEDMKRLPIHDQRVGGLFLSGAPKAKNLYEIYFSNHPSAIDVLMQKKEELKRFLEDEVRVTPPGDLYLTQSLSSVFRRLEKYPTLFKELERYLDEFHADRGDTQRAFSVYQDILLRCHQNRHMRALELEVLHHPFRPMAPPVISQISPGDSITPIFQESEVARIQGWRGDGDLKDLGPVVLLSEVFVLNLKKLKEDEALQLDNNNELMMSSQYSEQSLLTITTTMTEDGSSASISSAPTSDLSSSTLTVGTLVSNDTLSEAPSPSETSNCSTPTPRSNAIPIPGASPNEGNSPSPAVTTNGPIDSPPKVKPNTPVPEPSAVPSVSQSTSTPIAKKQFLILYPSALMVLSVSPCMKQFILDCRFDGDTSNITANVIPPATAASMLLDSDGASFDGLNSSTVSSFPPQNALGLFGLPGTLSGTSGSKLNAIFTSKIDRDVWLEHHFPPPTHDSGLAAPSQGTSISSPSTGVTPSSSPIPPPPASSPPLLGAPNTSPQGLQSHSPQATMVGSQHTSQGELSDPHAVTALDTQISVTTSSPGGASLSSSPPPTLVPITNIPPPNPYTPSFKPQEFPGKPPAPPPPAISPHPPPLPPPPSSYSIILSAAAAANNQDILTSGLTSNTTLSHSPSPQHPQSETLPSVIPMQSFNKSATLPTEHPPTTMDKAATLPARLNRTQTSAKSHHHLSRPPVIPIHHPQWTLSCLRPNPPVRPNLASSQSQGSLASSFATLRNGDGTSKVSLASMASKATLKKPVEESLLDESEILKVIESYCTTVKARNTVNSSLLDCPQVLIAEEEKIIVEERKGNQLVVEEKTLVDTVYALKDQVSDIMDQMKDLRNTLEHERKARKRMEMTIRKTLKSGHDISSNLTSTSGVSSAPPPPPPGLPPPLPSQPPPSAPPPMISISNEANETNVFV